MGFVFMVVIGAILGWLASIVARVETLKGILVNVGTGIAGALLTDFLISPLLSNNSIFGGTNSVATLLLSLLGSVLLLLAVNFIRSYQLR
ncbi:GlsB/YeaQ/YmgE family stress response membrane protein [Altererythrobacter indicus]|uniref:GlsB/YeaQ/YmgE family stress response membrane protein n=1 Tax=Altericroceibacterium indicum TaxID=374177 RepID=A0A845A9Y3_9SPHN|nr:GlsB/YeaQ/YmgE family stress response membrane protein [Altericroceibacterium indicum]MXP26317.1 GlsB/YeaQ/YmgE family stress response membrane protein [Altericroceibacterium indicum]